MIKPKLIDKISNLGNQPKQIFEVEILNPSICSETTLKKVKKMLFNVVDKKWGTAYSIKDHNVTMAGKTGTCQVDYSGDEEVQYISSFVGYFPADSPKYSCIVVIHRPSKTKGYYGSTVAAPVFKAIAKKIYNNTPKEVVLKTEQLEDLLTGSDMNNGMPNVLGLEVKKAVEILKKVGWQVETIGEGTVVSQKIKEIKNAESDTIILTLS